MAFSREEAARLAGLSGGQVAEWTDMVKPSWRTSGLYTFRDLVALRTMRRLQEEHKISTQQLRRATRYLAEHSETPWSELRIGVAPRKQLCFWNAQANGWEAADASKQMVDQIALEGVASDLRKAVESDRKRRSSDFGRIVSDRGVCGGAERFAGTRIAVSTVVSLLRSGATLRQVRAEFPTLTRQDIHAAREKLSAA